MYRRLEGAENVVTRPDALEEVDVAVFRIAMVRNVGQVHVEWGYGRGVVGAVFWQSTLARRTVDVDGGFFMVDAIDWN